jgi:hypothetical protein
LPAAVEVGGGEQEQILKSLLERMRAKAPEDYVVVLGVLSAPLDVTLQCGGADLCGLELSNVHVVDALPVPLHVSLMQLMWGSSQSRELQELGLGTGTHAQPEMAMASFPEAYRGHAFWAPSVSTFIASLPCDP